MENQMRRFGASLLEVVVVVTIVGVLIAILLPAVQKVRVASQRMTSLHNLKQIQLASLNFATANGDRLASIDGDLKGPNPNQSAFVAILPFIEQSAAYRIAVDKPSDAPAVQLFLDPADPTLNLGQVNPYFTGPVPPSISNQILNQNKGVSSYAANAQVFRAGYTTTASISDGHSNTIAFAMHYASGCFQTYFKYATYNCGELGRRATFADGGPWRTAGLMNYYLDLYPYTTGTPPVSRPAQGTVQGLYFPSSDYTFQVVPNARKNCDRDVPQTPYVSGLPVALMDGSVRILNPGIAQSAFWGAVSPAGGEMLLDW